MNIRSKMIVSLIVLVVLIGAMAASATGIEPFASTLIQSCTVSITADSGGVMNAGASIIAKSTVDEIGATYLRIQEKRDGSWVTVKVKGNGKNTNSKSYSTTLSRTTTVGTECRAQASLYVDHDGTKESRSLTSGTKTAKN